MTTLEKCKFLKENFHKLPVKDQDFAKDLATKGLKYQQSTPKQIYWIDNFVAVIEGKQPSFPNKEAVQVGGFQKVVELFDLAKKNLKWPKVILSCMGTPVYLSVAGPTAKNPGWINVKGEGAYPVGAWYGRVNPTGSWHPGKDATPDFLEALTDLLTEFGENPAEVAKKYGKLTGNCCFCNSGLTDPRSTAAGFGPTCAKNYGLYPEWKKAADLLKNSAETAQKYQTPLPSFSDAMSKTVSKFADVMAKNLDEKITKDLNEPYALDVLDDKGNLMTLPKTENEPDAPGFVALRSCYLCGKPFCQELAEVPEEYHVCPACKAEMGEPQ